jgi:alpha-galactosidase
LITTISDMRRNLLACILGLIFAGCSNNPHEKSVAEENKIPPIDKSLAIKPPMGWNSWDCLGWGANEAEVKEAADYMAKNLRHLGYEYVVIDMLWYGDDAASDFEAFVHETIPVKPNYTLDEFGRLLPDPVKFPSSAGGNGFKPLAEYIHSLGLKFGLHMLRGIPWQAADKNMPIKGTSIGARSIAMPDNGCVWYDGFYGVDMSKPGAQEYYNSQFGLFAQWGVDFIKADDIVNIPELEGISKASRLCGRKIVLSVVPDNIPFDILRKNAHMARTGADFWDVWQMVKVGFPVAAAAVKQEEPGFWPDLDMLPVGKLGLKISYKGPDPRISNFNNEELHTLLTLWYISRMPLMIGGYLPETDQVTLDLLTNEEALEVNRNSINPRQLKFRNATIIWAADIPGSEDKYLAFFNQWESHEPVNIKVALAQLGLDSVREYKVRDLWAKRDLGNFRGEFNAPIKAHGAGLYKISNK